MAGIEDMLVFSVKAHLFKTQLTPGNQKKKKNNKVSTAWTLTSNRQNVLQRRSQQVYSRRV